MRYVFILVILFVFIGVGAAGEDRTMAVIKLKNGSELRGHIVKSDTNITEIIIMKKKLHVPTALIDKIITDISDPMQFTFPNQLPEESKTWEIPVYWLKEQILYHDIRGIETFEIAVDFESQKLYLRGFGQSPGIAIPDSVMMMIRSYNFNFGYYEKIPPDNGP